METRLMEARHSQRILPHLPAAECRPSILRKGMPWVAWLACLGLAGCTMCPDPFDYSGPVPNGAVTQNDFAARSNGIRPVRAAPLPWPPIVQQAPEATPDASGAGEPLLAEATGGPDAAGALPADAPAESSGDGTGAQTLQQAEAPADGSWLR